MMLQDTTLRLDNEKIIDEIANEYQQNKGYIL